MNTISATAWIITQNPLRAAREFTTRSHAPRGNTPACAALRRIWFGDVMCRRAARTCVPTRSVGTRNPPWEKRDVAFGLHHEKLHELRYGHSLQPLLIGTRIENAADYFRCETRAQVVIELRHQK